METNSTSIVLIGIKLREIIENLKDEYKMSHEVYNEMDNIIEQINNLSDIIKKMEDKDAKNITKNSFDLFKDKTEIDEADISQNLNQIKTSKLKTLQDQIKIKQQEIKMLTQQMNDLKSGKAEISEAKEINTEKLIDVKLSDWDYEVKIMDSTHLKMRGKGKENWSIPMHFNQVADEVIQQLKQKGLTHGNFFNDVVDEDATITTTSIGGTASTQSGQSMTPIYKGNASIFPSKVGNIISRYAEYKSPKKKKDK